MNDYTSKIPSPSSVKCYQIVHNPLLKLDLQEQSLRLFITDVIYTIRLVEAFDMVKYPSLMVDRNGGDITYDVLQKKLKDAHQLHRLIRFFQRREENIHMSRSYTENNAHEGTVPAFGDEPNFQDRRRKVLEQLEERYQQTLASYSDLYNIVAADTVAARRQPITILNVTIQAPSGVVGENTADDAGALDTAGSLPKAAASTSQEDEVVHRPTAKQSKSRRKRKKKSKAVEEKSTQISGDPSVASEAISGLSVVTQPTVEEKSTQSSTDPSIAHETLSGPSVVTQTTVSLPVAALPTEAASSLEKKAGASSQTLAVSEQEDLQVSPISRSRSKSSAIRIRNVTRSVIDDHDAPVITECGDGWKEVKPKLHRGPKGSRQESHATYEKRGKVLKKAALGQSASSNHPVSATISVRLSC